MVYKLQYNVYEISIKHTHTRLDVIAFYCASDIGKQFSSFCLLFCSCINLSAQHTHIHNQCFGLNIEHYYTTNLIYYCRFLFVFLGWK